MLQREVPVWVAVVVIIVVVLVVVGIYWWRQQPRVQEGMTPPPTAPIYKAGPALSPEATPRLPQEREGKEAQEGQQKTTQ